MMPPLIFRPGKWANRLFDAGWSCELQPEQAIFQLEGGELIGVDTTAIVNASVQRHWLFWRVFTVDTPTGPRALAGLTPPALKTLVEAAKASVVARFDGIKVEVSALHDRYMRFYQSDCYLRSYAAMGAHFGDAVDIG